MNRRTFIRGALVTAIFAVGGAGVYVNTRGGQVSVLARILRWRFRWHHDLGDAPERFAEDLVAVAGGLAYEQRLDTLFILCTDYFKTGRDPARPLRYEGLFGALFFENGAPFVVPCQYPLERRAERR